MTPDQRSRVGEIFFDALDQPENNRDAFVEQVCGGDDVLYQAVKTLLRGHEQASILFGESPWARMERKPVELLPGQRVKHYEIVTLLGSGGMGGVYKARDTRLGRFVALKIVFDSAVADTDRIDRFRREARAASAVNHPNLVVIYDVGDHDGLSFIAMEYVEGKTLAAHIQEAPFTAADIVRIGIQLAQVLDAAHAAGITHRDIKPANVILTPEGQPKILDFGLAKIMPTVSPNDTCPSDPPTRSGWVIGTLSYMSPEQLSRKSISHSTDVFSLGLVLYEMATAGNNARTPAAERPPNQMQSKVMEAMTSSSKLDTIIRRCLEREPERRYTARELAVELREIQKRAPKEVLGVLIVGLVIAILGFLGIGLLGVDPSIQRLEADDFDRLLNAYTLRNGVLTRNYYLQAILIGIGIGSTVVSRSRRIRIPGLQNNLSLVTLPFVFVPILLYLWGEFGFALDDLIKYRAEAWQFLTLLGNPLEPPLNRRAMLFNDSMFMDGWFMCFRPTEHSINTSFLGGTALLFAFVFGILFSLNHSYIFLGLRSSLQTLTKNSTSLGSLLLRLVPWAGLGLILFMHLQFRFGGNHPNWIQGIIGGQTVFFIWIFSRRR